MNKNKNFIFKLGRVFMNKLFETKFSKVMQICFDLLA